MGNRFRAQVASFVKDHGIPVVRFTRADRKIDVMQPYAQAQAATSVSGAAAIGAAQELAPVFTATRREAPNNLPWFDFYRADRRVTCYYFYLWDEDFGLAFVKVCAYFPYPMKIWVNGHEWAKRQAGHAWPLRHQSDGAQVRDPHAPCRPIREVRGRHPRLAPRAVRHVLPNTVGPGRRERRERDHRRLVGQAPRHPAPARLSATA